MLAAAGYNAGVGAVEKWRRYYAPDDVPGFIESISYTETRGYVKKILRSYWMYRSLYPMESESRERARRSDRRCPRARAPALRVPALLHSRSWPGQQ